MENIINKTFSLYPIFSMAAYDQNVHQLEEIEELEEVNGRRTRRFVERTDPFTSYSDKDILLLGTDS